MFFYSIIFSRFPKLTKFSQSAVPCKISHWAIQLHFRAQTSQFDGFEATWSLMTTARNFLPLQRHQSLTIFLWKAAEKEKILLDEWQSNENCFSGTFFYFYKHKFYYFSYSCPSLNLRKSEIRFKMKTMAKYIRNANKAPSINDDIGISEIYGAKFELVRSPNTLLYESVVKMGKKQPKLSVTRGLIYGRPSLEFVYPIMDHQATPRFVETFGMLLSI